MDSIPARDLYMHAAAAQNWSTRTLERQIGTLSYDHLLKCFVLIDLKTGHLTHQDISQMDMYVRLYDDQRRGEGDNPTACRRSVPGAGGPSPEARPRKLK